MIKPVASNLLRTTLDALKLRDTRSLPESARHNSFITAFRVAFSRKINPVQIFDYHVSYAGRDHLKYLFKEIFVDHSYAFHAEGEAPVILDCGSNIGMSILYFKLLYPGARITGFEPDPATFAILQKNVQQNNLQNVEVHCCALSDREETLPFFRGKNDGSLLMSLLPERSSGNAVDVRTQRLSSFVASEIDLLKLDVEGAESLVLPELASAGVLPRIRQIHLEYHHHIRADVDNFSSMLSLLEDHGFGYQILAQNSSGPSQGGFQDISVYCYRKNIGLSTS